MTSQSGQGYTGITLQFRLDRNIDAAAQDVQAAISGVQRRLPKAMPAPPSFRKNDPSAQPIFLITLWSNSLPISKVDQYSRTLLANQISTIDGVAQVTIMGSAKYAVRIQADPSALAARNMGLNDLISAVATTSTDQASGTLNGPTKSTIIYTQGQLMNAEQFRNQIVAYRGGAPVKFGDVATVVDSVEKIIAPADWSRRSARRDPGDQPPARLEHHGGGGQYPGHPAALPGATAQRDQDGSFLRPQPDHPRRGG